MSLFGFLLLILFGYFIIWPVVKVLLRINAAKRQFRDMMNGGAASAAGFGAGHRDESRRKGGWSRAPRRRRKKIPDGTGEYVAFEEITVTTQTTTESTAAGEHARTDYTVEQQIVDVEWEDVK